MHHLFLGIPAGGLGRLPYAAVILDTGIIPAPRAGLTCVSPEASFFFLPNIAGFVGSDAQAVALVAGMDERSRPTLAAAAMLAFIFFWNDFITPLLYLRSQRLYTLSIGLMQLQEMDKTNWPLVLAAAALVTLPPLLIFLAVQRKFLNESWLSGK